MSLRCTAVDRAARPLTRMWHRVDSSWCRFLAALDEVGIVDFDVEEDPS